MTPQNFADRSPRLDLLDYFGGQTRAWGIFEDRFGNLRREFTVEINGFVEGDSLLLDERFQYSDGETDRRVWQIRRKGMHDYSGTAADVIGEAVGKAYGNALNWRYDMNLKVGNSTWKVHFDDWMFLQRGGVLINRATVTRFGIEIGSVSIFFQKPARRQRAALQ